MTSRLIGREEKRRLLECLQKLAERCSMGRRGDSQGRVPRGLHPRATTVSAVLAAPTVQSRGRVQPYLSQIERGLRKPSAEILQQIARALRISAEALYVRAGILDQVEEDREVTAAVLADDALTERQKQVLLEIYAAFRRENILPPSMSTSDYDVGKDITMATKIWTNSDTKALRRRRCR